MFEINASEVFRGVLNLETDFAGHGSHCRQQSHNRQGCDGLSRSRLSYEAKDTAPRNAEAHITHCGHRARRTGKLHAQVSYFEEHSFMLAVVLEGGH